MEKMFCFQCEQTAGGKGCTRVGVCGKDADTANMQDALTAALCDLAMAYDGRRDQAADALIMRGLFTTITNVNFDESRVAELEQSVRAKTAELGGKTRTARERLWAGDEDAVSLRWTLLLGLRGMAAYAWHAYVLGQQDEAVTRWFYKGLKALIIEHSIEEWRS